jgi:hypothetical protein
MTIYKYNPDFEDRPNPTPNRDPELMSSNFNLSEAPLPSEIEHAIEIDMKHKRSSEILSLFVETTGAKPYVHTQEELQEREEFEKVKNELDKLWEMSGKLSGQIGLGTSTSTIATSMSTSTSESEQLTESVSSEPEAES